MNPRVYRFGNFQLLVPEGELRGHASSVQLQEKPLQMLIALLEHAPQLVTRDHLRECMWSDNTFVDYEQGINVAVKKLRDALGDSAVQPTYIQTIARKGYRFLLPVEASDCDQQAKAPAAPALDSRPARRWRNWVYAAAPIVFLVLTGSSMLLPRSHARRRAPIRSIAVLPLQNLSADAEQDYFAAGMTEELITDLAQQSDLRVTSHTSVMRYKGTTEPLTRIARELGVDAIVEGSVERSGNRVRVTAQLLDGSDDHHIWAASYDGDSGEVLAVQSRIARQIVAEVDTTLSPESRGEELKTRRVDPQVLDACLLARYELNKRTREGLEKAIDRFQQAADRDPSYAPAFAGLASAYFLLPEYSQVPHDPFLAKASAYAQKAIELDGTLAEPHATLGMLEMSAVTFDWNRMDREFKRAIQLNPSLSTAHHWYAFYLLMSRPRRRRPQRYAATAAEIASG